MKTISFIFQGEPGNIGRFGWVTHGAPLPLSPREAQDVSKDKRFKRSEKDLFPLEYQPGKIAQNESEEQTKARLKSDSERQALYDHLNTEFEVNERPEKSK